LKSCSRQQNSG